MAQHRLLFSTTIDVAQTEADNAAQNLVVMFDSAITFELHVANLCRSACYHLYSIGRVRRYLNQQCARQLVRALVII